ncbi:MAG: sulfatase-like hydrolase/transferase [Pirellulales bacterium]
MHPGAPKQVVPKQIVVVPPSAICLVFDRLQAGALGAYGNTWLPTPNLDELAARSFLFDRCFADAPQLASAYQAYWYGRDAFSPASEAGQESLAAQLKSAGVKTMLVTDAPEVASAPGAADFAERILVEHEPVKRLAKSLEQTQLFRLMAAAIDAASEPSQPFLLWIHARAMAGPWDAPFELREQFVEEDDPPPGDFFELPSLRLAADHDPDELLPLRFAYAAQIVLVDHCVGAFLEAIDERTKSAPGPLLWALTSPRGYPLGEHGFVGATDEKLYNELVHVPLLLGSSDGTGAMARSNALVAPADLFATLCDWWQLKETAPPWAASLLPNLRDPNDSAARDRLALRTPHDRALRTAAWSLRLADDDRAELFAKPDDRWEVNELADRCADVATALRESLNDYIRIRAEGKPADLPPLTPELRDEIH